MKYLMAGIAMASMAVGGMSLASCSDLDEKPYTFIDPNSFYKNEGEVQEALNGVYNRFRRIYSGNNSLYVAELELLTEQGWPTYNKDNMHELSQWSYANSASVGGVMKTSVSDWDTPTRHIWAATSMHVSECQDFCTRRWRRMVTSVPMPCSHTLRECADRTTRS